MLWTVKELRSENGFERLVANNAFSRRFAALAPDAIGRAVEALRNGGRVHLKQVLIRERQIKGWGHGPGIFRWHEQFGPPATILFFFDLASKLLSFLRNDFMPERFMRFGTCRSIGLNETVSVAPASRATRTRDSSVIGSLIASPVKLKPSP